ncbi:MAG: LpqB family beta-propeller protein [Actinomycetota bacterium]|nr:LpqB family beta-propeller protein [Actinomycetota bacterium]
MRVEDSRATRPLRTGGRGSRRSVPRCSVPRWFPVPPSSRSLRVLLPVLALCLQACVGMPDSGPVVPGGPVDGVRNGIPNFFPDGPRAGAGPLETVRGFLRAGAAFKDDHAVARSFLTARTRSSWKPDTQVVVFPGEDKSIELTSPDRSETFPEPSPGGATRETGGVDPALSSTPTGTGAGSVPSGSPSGPDVVDVGNALPTPVTAVVRARARMVATVDAAGCYRQAQTEETVTRTFRLVISEGQWRINSLDDGTFVSQGNFGYVFQSRPVYFADPSRNWLVPDVRWFPVSEPSATPTYLVSALLDGPSPWLRDAVVTGAPAGTGLTVGAVAVDSNGVAAVDLTEEALTADAESRLLLVAQLKATLERPTAVLDVRVTSVSVTVEQTRFDTPSSSEDRSQDSRVRFRTDPTIDGRPVAIDSRGRIVRLTEGKAVVQPQLEALQGASSSWPAVSYGGDAYAVLSRGRLLHAVPGESTAFVVHTSPTGKSDSLTPPSFDPLGWLWTARADGPGTVLAGEDQQKAHEVRADWLEGLVIRSLRISRDGARAVVVTQAGGRSRLWVAGVLRDDHGYPRALGTPLQLVPDLRTARGAAWADESHVVVLGQLDKSGEKPWTVEVSGTVEGLAPLSGAQSVTVGNGPDAIYLGTRTGTAERTLSSWTQLPGLRWPSVPG